MSAHHDQPSTLRARTAAQPAFYISRAVACVVLVAALVMCAPGEHDLAQRAGYGADISWLAPVILSLYAATAIGITSSMEDGAPRRRSAQIACFVSSALALCAQVAVHLIEAHYLPSRSYWTTAGFSMMPVIAAAHMMHLISRPRQTGARTLRGITSRTTGTAARALRVVPAQPPVMPAQPAPRTPAPAAQRPAHHAPQRAVGVREASRETGVSESTLRGWIKSGFVINRNPDGEPPRVFVRDVRDHQAAQKKLTP